MAELAWTWLDAPDGVVGIVADPQAILRIYYLASRQALATVINTDYPAAGQRVTPLLSRALAQLDDYLRGLNGRFCLPLSDQGLSPFSQAVHRALCAVPCGEVISYAQLARRAGSPRAARAVGRIMATNPFPLVVPCHRVIRSDGSLGDYSAAHGTASKSRLLAAERRMTQKN